MGRGIRAVLCQTESSLFAFLCRGQLIEVLCSSLDIEIDTTYFEICWFLLFYYN